MVTIYDVRRSRGSSYFWWSNRAAEAPNPQKYTLSCIAYHRLSTNKGEILPKYENRGGGPSTPIPKTLMGVSVCLCFRGLTLKGILRLRLNCRGILTVKHSSHIPDLKPLGYVSGWTSKNITEFFFSNYLTSSTYTNTMGIFGALRSVFCFSKVIEQFAPVWITEQQTLIVTWWYWIHQVNQLLRVLKTSILARAHLKGKVELSF